MHYYQFNIGDYQSHTSHLNDIEDLAYRRMLDWCYLHESPLPENLEQIAKLIRMRTHIDCIADVLQDFFTLTEYGWINKRVMREVKAYQDKSDKAKASANARWSKNRDADALRTECESNAKHKPLTINQETVNKIEGQQVPYQLIVDTYHKINPNLPRVAKLTDARKRAIKARWNEDIKHQSKEFWEWYWKRVSTNDHWQGQNERGWQANMDWFMKPSNFYKPIEMK